MRTEVVVIGGGQAGLAMSHCLAERRIEHVVLERGRIGERWLSERWDSLRLLSPNWQTRLPGFHYRGPDPHGYMTKSELVAYLRAYARASRAPVEGATNVLGVSVGPRGYRVDTDRGVWQAANVVIATGHCDVPAIPGFAERLPHDVVQVAAAHYRNPAQLPEGGVLVVGASATGVQLAEEIARSGRRVALAVGRHTRLPRVYRGRDILFWLDAMGVLDESAETVHDLERSRRQPSFQLVGTPERRTLDLGALQRQGVWLLGAAVDADGDQLELCDDLVGSVIKADAKLARLLMRIDAFVERAGLAGEVGPREAIAPLSVPSAPTSLSLRERGIDSVVWATGFRRNYDWLRVPVLDERGEIRHRGGVTDAAGLYVLGMRFQRRRNSSFIDGVGADALALAEHIGARRARRAGALAVA
jgi:putative flavoprotein involved in K+ transport